MKYQILSIAAVTILAATASAATTLAITSNASNSAASSTNPQHVISQDDFTNAAESTVNGVVSVKSYATPRSYGMQSNDFFSDPFSFFFGQPQQRQQPQQEQPKQRQIGLGSGVIISKDGYIVTNNHVIADAERLEVTLNDNRNYNAKVIGADATTDLALIKIDAENLHVIPIGDSEALKVGEWVLAVGNPFGFTSTVTSGIVSAKARNISTTTGSRSTNGIESYIQTDAAVNQGNSGGALVNLKGELVGINTAIYSQTGNYVGCSFAIPSTIVSKVIDDLKQYGTVQRAYLGVRFQELTPELISEKKIKGITTGLYVASVEDRSAAREAGLQEGDVIIAVGGNDTPNTARLQESIAKFSPGDNVDIKFVRDGKVITKKVTLRNQSGDTKVTKAESVVNLGCAFSAVPKERLEQLEISNGVAVGGLEDGRFKEAGIRDGFIIISVNGKRVNSADDIENIYNSIMKSGDDKVMYIKGIYPTGKQQFYAVPLTD